MKQKKSTKTKSIPKTKSVQKLGKSKGLTKTKTLKEIQISLQQYNFKQQGHKIKLKLHKPYQIGSKHQLFSKIKNYYNFFLQKQIDKDQHLYNISQFSYYPLFEFKLSGQNPTHQKCSICQFQFEDLQDLQKQIVQKNDTDIVSLKCSHLLHWSCFKMLVGDKQWVKCPVCSSIYGYMVGDQPQGTMEWTVHSDMHCQGYPDVGTIFITYQMKSGSRGNINYPGTGRNAYLPDNEGGRQVLELLKTAFDRKLIFTIGRSVTTGRDNQIVWNGIHHKTNLSGGSAYFGYPDDTYFQRVKLELAAKGIY